MPGEQLLSEAARGWTGPEAAVFGALVVLVLITAVGLWRHLGECKVATERLHQRVSEQAKELSEMGKKVAWMCAKLEESR